MKRAETQVSPRVSPPVTLAVTEYGDRSSSTHVLMVHGFPDDQQMWEPVVSSLPETCLPICSKRLASVLMPDPPIPTRWLEFSAKPQRLT